MTDAHEPEPATAVLDEAHTGDIQGAFGTIRRSGSMSSCGP